RVAQEPQQLLALEFHPFGTVPAVALLAAPGDADLPADLVEAALGAAPGEGREQLVQGVGGGIVTGVPGDPKSHRPLLSAARAARVERWAPVGLLGGRAARNADRADGLVEDEPFAERLGDQMRA